MKQKLRMRIFVVANSNDKTVVRKGENTTIIIDASGRGNSDTTHHVGESVTVTVRGGTTATQPSKEEKTYHISVHTGNIRYAGTDANVFITLYGSNCSSPKLLLNKSQHKDLFERGQVDTFEIKTRDVGILYQVKVCHDNTGRFPGWYLNKIVIKEGEDKKGAVFECFDWLFKASRHNNLSETLAINGTPIVSIEPFPENFTNHHTDKFQLVKNSKMMIVRRGQSFKLHIKLAREYEGANDDFFFVLKTGNRPREADKTLVTVKEFTSQEFTKRQERDKWGFRVMDYADEIVNVEIFIPSGALVGRFDVSIENDDGVIYAPEAKCCILFNPWCKDDEVYMRDENNVKEYILRQRGLIYRNTAKRPSASDWYFGQFEEISLDTVFDLLDDVKPKKRNSAREVARIISSKGNGNDNNGILQGRWDGKYDDGKAPTSWNSTPDIFQTYQKCTDNCVKYGQCWVFSAVLTTLFRAIGIPCRPITNYSSAHDSDGNCSNDIYFDADGEHLEDKSSDSVWNYHCWNDVWMARPDLPPGYGGWQAVDATPQERSMGLFQMGPCSLLAVKEGEIDQDYDAAFVFAEVNADTIYWRQQEDGEFEVVYRKRDSVGEKQVTKAVGTKEMHDITDEYKFKEGSMLERAAVKNALLKSHNIAVTAARKEIECEITTVDSDYSPGNNLTAKLCIKNTCEVSRSMTLVWKVIVVRYDGVLIKLFKKEKSRITVAGNKDYEMKIDIPAKEIIEFLSEESIFRITATASVDETKQLVVKDHSIGIDRPDIVFKTAPGTAKVGEPVEFVATFQNPLSIALTNCEWKYDGSIIVGRRVEKTTDVKPNETFEWKFLVTPDRLTNVDKKKRGLMVSFFCKQLGGIQKYLRVLVSHK